jgi:hypothetical protein
MKGQPVLLLRLPCGKLVQVSMGCDHETQTHCSIARLPMRPSVWSSHTTPREVEAAMAAMTWKARQMRQRTGQHLLVEGRLRRHDLVVGEVEEKKDGVAAGAQR